MAVPRTWRLKASTASVYPVMEIADAQPAGFRLSVLRIFDPATPVRVVDAAESHFKHALDSRRHGLNRN